MTYGAFTTQDYASFGSDLRAPQPTRHLALFVAALTLSVMTGVGLLYVRERTVRLDEPGVALASVASHAPEHRVAPPSAAIAPLRRYAGMLSPSSLSGQMPVTFAQSAPLRAGFEAPRAAPQPAVVAAAEVAPAAAPVAEPPVEAVLPVPADLVDIPMPMPRPALLPTAVAPPRARTVDVATAPAAPPEDGRSMLDKIFGTGEPVRPALAYAPVDGGLSGAGRSGYDRWTAVYDIAAHTVYLPDGRRLEAHSGLGAHLDDPRSVTEHMRGATPPAVYDLSLRESLFHGVRALRLNPTDANATFGRGGLLAHTFMLGPRGDSNGCVVFRDYQSFVQAFDRGDVKRLAVVASLR